MEFSGTHGTSREFGDRLNAGERFMPSRGRMGDGVYFWEDDDISHELAVAWWRYRCISQNLGAVPGCVVAAKFSCETEEFLNLRDPINLRRVREAFRSVGHLLKGDPKKKAQFMHDIIEGLDRARGPNRIKVVAVQVAPPPGWRFPTDMFPDPFGYVVRDQSIIEVTKVTPC